MFLLKGNLLKIKTLHIRLINLHLCLLICFLLQFPFPLADVYGQVYPVKSYDDFYKAQQVASKGDSIVWKSGVYSNVSLDVFKNGLNIYAEKPGSVIFTGQSNVIILADSTLFSGFQFKDGKTGGDVLKVSGSYNNLDNLNFSNYVSHYYLNILPGSQYNLLSKCNFEKKPENPNTSVVQIQVHESIPGYHKIQYCSFKNHTAPSGTGNDYGIEALRIGYSWQSAFISRTVVEYCYFTRCNGDGEIISSKARETVYRYNTFENNGESHFTLRHGSDNVVYSNFFIGGAGIRIKEGQNQMVYNNYFETGNRFAINLMNHKADPLNNIIIAHNSFVNSGPLLLGGVGDYKPKSVAIINNLFLAPTGVLVFKPTGEENFAGNMTDLSLANLPKGISEVSLNYHKDNRVVYNSQAKKRLSSKVEIPVLIDIPLLDDDSKIQLDIMKQDRTDKTSAQVVGSFVPTQNVVLKPLATAQTTGPDYLRNK